MAFLGNGSRPARAMPSFATGYATHAASEGAKYWRGLKLAFAPFLGPSPDPTKLVWGKAIRRDSTVVAGQIAEASGPYGFGWEFTATTDVIDFGDATRFFDISTPDSVTFIYCGRKTDGVFRNTTLIGVNDNGGGGSHIGLRLPFGDEHIYWEWQGATSVNFDATGHTWQDFHVYAVTAGPRGSHLYIDGRHVAGNATTAALASPSGFNMKLGRRAGGSGEQTDLWATQLLYMWDTDLGDAAIAQLSADPGLLFRPRQMMAPMVNSEPTIEVTIAGTSTVSATFEAFGVFDGTAAGTATAAADVGALGSFAGSAAGIATATATVTAFGAIAGISISTSGAVADITSGVSEFAGTAAGTSTASATVVPFFDVPSSVISTFTMESQGNGESSGTATTTETVAVSPAYDCYINWDSIPGTLLSFGVAGRFDVGDNPIVLRVRAGGNNVHNANGSVDGTIVYSTTLPANTITDLGELGSLATKPSGALANSKLQLTFQAVGDSSAITTAFPVVFVKPDSDGLGQGILMTSRGEYSSPGGPETVRVEWIVDFDSFESVTDLIFAFAGEMGDFGVGNTFKIRVGGTSMTADGDVVMTWVDPGVAANPGKQRTGGSSDTVENTFTGPQYVKISFTGPDGLIQPSITIREA